MSEVCVLQAEKRQVRAGWLLKAAAAAGLALVSAPAAADYSEGASGDLSNNPLAPTPVTLAVGNNIISGSTGQANSVIDRDYFTFTLAAGQQLTAIQVLAGTTSLSGPNPSAPLSFIGLQAGSTVTDPAAPVVGALLGYTHYGPSLIGTDILDDISHGAGAQGFTPPLGAGTYSVWIQEANVGSASYVFNFLVASVPEPSTWMMMLAGFGLMGLALRRNRAQIRSGPSSERSLAM